MAATSVGLVTVWLIVLVGIILFGETVKNRNFWAGWEYDPGPWCERERTNDFIREPANAYSDFSFLAAGLAMIYFGLNDYNLPNRFVSTSGSLLRKAPSLAITAGLANIIHACGTFWNHACRCQKGHQLDVAGMCLVIGFNGFYCIFRWIHQWKPNIKLSTLIPSFHVSFAIFFFILWPISDLRYAEDSVETTETVLVVVLVLLTFIPLATYSYNFRDTISHKYLYLVAAITTLGLAVKFHKNDMMGINCDPDSIFQGHAIWHVATAIALISIFLFFRSESEKYHSQTPLWSRPARRG